MANEKDDLRPNQGPQTISITIQEKDGLKADEILKIPQEDRVIFLPPTNAFIMKGAMDSGKSSVTIYAKTAQGEHVFFETSGKILRGIANIVDQIDGKNM